MANKGYFLLVLFSLLLITTILKFSKKEECKYLIVLDNKKEIRSRNINWYESGFVDIRKCDGTSITYMDNFIDTIIIKK